ncbi:MAG: hypothetical protein R3C01_06485 [Planctomycetaceae bacterium]
MKETVMQRWRSERIAVCCAVVCLVLTAGAISLPRAHFKKPTTEVAFGLKPQGNRIPPSLTKGFKTAIRPACLTVEGSVDPDDGPLSNLLAIDEITDETGVVELPVDSLYIEAMTGTLLRDLEIPDVIKGLHGRRVRLNGIMNPTSRETGLTSFLFIPETTRKPIAPRPRDWPLGAMIIVQLDAGQSECYQARPFTIEGILEIDIDIEADQVYSVYRIHEAHIVNRAVKLPFHPAIALWGC